MAATEETVETVQEAPRGGVSPGQIALLVGGIVVVLALVWFFFLRGGNEPVEQSSPPPTSESESAATEDSNAAAKKAPKKKGNGPVETFELFAAKDPFEPLVDETPDAAGSTTTPSTTTPGTTTPGTTSPGTTIPGTTSPGTTSPGSGGEAVGGHSVRLVDVFTKNGRPRAQVEVDGTVYTVGDGEVFADNFQVVSISGECATMLFGDDQFTLCEGEEILK